MNTCFTVVEGLDGDRYQVVRKRSRNRLTTTNANKILSRTQCGLFNRYRSIKRCDQPWGYAYPPCSRRWPYSICIALLYSRLSLPDCRRQAGRLAFMTEPKSTFLFMSSANDLNASLKLALVSSFILHPSSSSFILYPSSFIPQKPIS